VGETIINLVLASTVYVEEFKGGFGSEPAEHLLDAPLDEVITNIIGPRIKMMDVHALLIDCDARLLVCERLAAPRLIVGNVPRTNRRALPQAA
jgi:hypothetical protein